MSCKCRQCFSLAEYMQGVTGKDYGLTPAPGHASPELREVKPSPASMTELDSDEFKRLQQQARNRVRQPWETAA